MNEAIDNVSKAAADSQHKDHILCDVFLREVFNQETIQAELEKQHQQQQRALAQQQQLATWMKDHLQDLRKTLWHFESELQHHNIAVAKEAVEKDVPLDTSPDSLTALLQQFLATVREHGAKLSNILERTEKKHAAVDKVKDIVQKQESRQQQTEKSKTTEATAQEILNIVQHVFTTTSEHSNTNTGTDHDASAVANNATMLQLKDTLMHAERLAQRVTELVGEQLQHRRLINQAAPTEKTTGTGAVPSSTTTPATSAATPLSCKSSRPDVTPHK